MLFMGVVAVAKVATVGGSRLWLLRRGRKGLGGKTPTGSKTTTSATNARGPPNTDRISRSSERLPKLRQNRGNQMRHQIGHLVFVEQLFIED
jgi:hypothetical protein